MKITVLGCGGSGGVPTAAGDWGTCDPREPRNQRTRPSILVEEGATTLLIDTGPDLRAQLLCAQPERISAILYTHCHADHTHGFDDIRYLNIKQKHAMDIYSDATTINELRNRFAYAFAPKAEGQFYRPAIVPHIIDGVFQVGDITIQPFVQDHGYTESLGFRFGKFAYSTDVKNLNAEAFKILAGVEVWIVDAVREEPHPVHSHVAQTVAWIAQVKPQHAYITHMNHTLDYATLAAKLPPGVEPAYDGMVIAL
jgi:phosphoribosyl 1,2-cyclic phosphate phosphodiesterase